MTDTRLMNSMNTEKDILAAIDARMQSVPGHSNADWYVGIASEVEQRLFGHHHVDRKLDTWLYRKAVSVTVARDIQAACQAAGCDGGSRDGDKTTVFVYAFLKSDYTNPDARKSLQAPYSNYSNRGPRGAGR
jgi:hypothetical protein